MIFEYIPTNPQNDKQQIKKICSILPISHILIPSNPVCSHHPESIVVSNHLKMLFAKEISLCHIDFIPTIKTSMHTLESLQSSLLSLRYTNIKKIAIISGDTKVQKSSIDTKTALQLIQTLKTSEAYFTDMDIFCAINSDIVPQTIQSFHTKIQYGVRHFITQPFYNIVSTISCYDSEEYKYSKEKLSYGDFLSFYQHKIEEYQQHMQTDIKNITFYCGFLPLMSKKQALNVINKKLGISIPFNYLIGLEHDPLQQNFKIFQALQHYNISMSYIKFKDIQQFLNFYMQYTKKDKNNDLLSK